MKHMGLRFLTLSVVCSCAICFAESEESDDAIALVIDLLKSGEPEMRTVAIAAVREMPGKEMTDALVKELPNLSVTTQVQLLSALGDRGDAAALPAVIVAAKAKDQSVRITALGALGQLGNASTVSLLAQTAAATTGDERKAARESLCRLRGSEVDEAILAGIPKAGAKTKVVLISSVGERNITAGVNTLLETAKDSDRKVRLESLKVLKVIAGPECLPALVELLLNLQSESDRGEVEKTVAAVAHKIEDKSRQAEAVLTVLPSVKDVKKRSSLLSVLGRIGDSSALPCLREALNSDNTEIQGAAIRALSSWPASDPAADLLKVAQSSGNRIHRILALRAAVRLLGLESGRPAKETIEMYSKAISLASDAGEKRRVLSGLANTKSLDALQMAAEYLQDKNLFREAEFAVVKIAEGIYGAYPQQTWDVLKKVIDASKNDSLRQQAQQVLDQIGRFEDYLIAWQVSGPYTKEGTDGVGLFDIAFGPEKADAGDVAWRIMPAGTNKGRPWLIDLDKVLGGDNRVAYLRTKVLSDKSRKVRLELGSDDGIKVWLNGQLVHANNATRPASPGQDRAEVTLKQGWNRLLLKLTQSEGEWAVCVRFGNLDGSRLEGLKVQIED